MPRRASAKRYARALFEIASQRDTVDAWAGDLRVVRETLQNEELKAFLEHAKIPLSRKVETIGQVLGEADQAVRNLLSLLVSRGLVELVPEVEEEYLQLLNELKGREQVEVQSAVPLEAGERERVTQYMAGLIDKEVLLDTGVDPSILGGLVIRVGYRLIDGSTRTRLDQLGKQLQQDSAQVVV